MSNVKHFSSMSELYAEASKNLAKFEDVDIRVEVPSSFAVDEALEDKHKEGLFPFTAKAYHDETNVNGSHIESDVFIENSKSMVLRPVLANVVKTEEGTKDFGAHDFVEYINDDGEYVCNYIEKPVGVITNYDFAFDSVQKVNRAIAHGVLYEGYAQDAIDILKERENVSCSIELSVRGLHFDQNTKVLHLDDYFVTGLTLLGEAHQPGMVGSELHLEEDSQSVVFNYFESLSEEKLKRLQEIGGVLFSETKEPEVKGDESMDCIKHIYPFEDNGEFFSCETKLSDREMAVMSAIYNGKASVGDVIVYDTFVVFRDWGSTDWTRENYELTDEGVVFSNGPVAVKCHWMTAEEEAAAKEETEQKFAALQKDLEDMNEKYSDYDEVKEKLAGYEQAELDAQKENILSDEAYAEYLETEEFAAVKEKMETLSIEELKTEAELAFAKCARKAKVQVSDNKENTAMKLFKTGNEDAEPTSKYGKIFSNK